jgi:2-polyprenyl-3-methyl-5-hydroxy-6-metoxy-1,4-benzoquinol methylase
MNEDTYETWRATYKSLDDWESTFQDGRWDYLAGIGELPRYAVVAGYIHKLLNQGRLLDAGCGEGVLLDYLDLERFDYTGFDLSPTAIIRARKRLRRGTVFERRIEQFEPPDGTRYDAIVFNESLQSTEAPLELIDRYRGFLSARGVIVLSLFKNPNDNANGPRLARFLAAECEKRRYSLVDRAEGTSVSHGLAWRILVLR